MSDNEGFRFDKVLDNIKRVKTELPQLIAKQAQNYFTDSWRRQGFGGHSWPEVQRRIQGTPEYKYMLRKHPTWIKTAINVNTGALRRAVSNSIRGVSFDRILLIAATDYAEFVNEKRQFMGETPELVKMQLEKINEFMSKVFV